MHSLTHYLYACTTIYIKIIHPSPKTAPIFFLKSKK